MCQTVLVLPHLTQLQNSRIILTLTNKCMSGFKVDLIYTSIAKVGKSLGHKIPLTIVTAYPNICLADPNRPGNEAN